MSELSFKGITWDDRDCALYIKLSNAEVVSTKESKCDSRHCEINVDYDEHGEVVGLEVLL